MTKKPLFKKLCSICKKYSFIKSGWNYCEGCYEKRFSKSRDEKTKEEIDNAS